MDRRNKNEQFTEKQNETIRKLYEEEQLTWREIGSRYGMTETAMRDYGVKVLKITLRRNQGRLSIRRSSSVYAFTSYNARKPGKSPVDLNAGLSSLKDS